MRNPKLRGKIYCFFETTMTQPSDTSIMKKIFTLLAFCSLSGAAFALDGQLILSNKGAGYDARMGIRDGVGEPKWFNDAYSVQLFRVTGGSETAVGSPIPFRAGPAAGFGYFVNTTITIPNFGDESGPATFRAKVFKGASFENSIGFRGISPDFTANVNVAPTPPVPTARFPQGLFVIPEPSTIALAGLGVVGLCVRRRG